MTFTTSGLTYNNTGTTGTNDFDLGDTSWLDDMLDDDGNIKEIDLFKDMNFDSTFNYDPSTTTDYSDYFDDDFKLKDFSKGNLLDDNYLKKLDFSGMDLTDYGFEDTISTKGIESLDKGIFGGDIGPYLKKLFLGEGDETGLLSQIIGGAGNNKSGESGSGVMGLLSSLVGGGGGGGILDSSLGKILLAKYLTGKDEGPGGYVPIGQEAYGGGGGQPSYQVPNLQPALLPGMAYANQPTTFNADPPGMQAGGLMAIPQGNKGLPNLPQSVRNNMGYMEAGGVASLENMMDGPGDITQAMLEPGEFVMTRKATENLTPEYLYNLMHQAENAGRR